MYYLLYLCVRSRPSYELNCSSVSDTNITINDINKQLTISILITPMLFNKR